ncbi:WD domain-containing protein [Paraphaeosphaeria sporulosa]|uniref:WD domain-containing protein n=1 Tax=Paraphaeosphaeria sporulosa TaxID=1460663 RepID=A0A177CIU8_9PLEO|nr:WD domain-containing protein [Paraphaeosphaeria sporulosa]OAG06750.1 WD domain-containing protein [Paraphaeosphaeria sporulosa]
MAQKLHHECTRVPITALAECGPLLIVAEGPYLRFYDRQQNILISSERLFEAQAIHGVRELSSSADHVHLVIWGGLLLRTLLLDTSYDEHDGWLPLNARCSDVARAPDWILDLQSAPKSPGNDIPERCVAVTAHNALLDITQELGVQYPRVESLGPISVSELTSSSRSILYSAHLLWESDDCILVAAGTAFGEIIYWSWNQSRPDENRSRIHHVFLGHEGSIFGVQISHVLCINGQKSRRLLASCSDDRTIRIWDVSRVTAEEGSDSHVIDTDSQRTRHTGFSNASFDADVSSKDCVAIGWGHTSRVWKVEFLDSRGSISVKPDKIVLLSAGEDATSRTWTLITNVDSSTSPSTPPWQLELMDTAPYHSGKNVWSISIPNASSSHRSVALGGADSKITKFSLRTKKQSTKQAQYDIEYFTSTLASLEESTAFPRKAGHRSSKQMEFLRSYAFVDASSFILTTNSGGIFLETLSQHGSKIDLSQLIAKPEDLCGYSVCAGEPSLGLAFVAGAKGTLYAYHKETSRLTQLHTFNGKIGEVFTGTFADSLQSKRIVLLVTLVGQKDAQLLHVDFSECKEPQYLYEELPESARPRASSTTVVPIPDHITGLVITSMVYVDTSVGSYVLLGYRRGSIAAYRIVDQRGEHADQSSAKLLGIIHSVHGKETVTAMTWVPRGTDSPSGHLVSTGRDGCVAIHLIELETMSYRLVHNITLPVGPNIEGLYIHNSELHVYGFSHKEFVVYNTATEEVTMSVETGGAHRSWSFQPDVSMYRGGGTLVWTRASSMHILSQSGPDHDVIRSGGHGREIKAVAVSPGVETDGSKLQLIATGAEDTDIKIFSYTDKHLTCLRTLRKHTTGIQNLQWSTDGSYLFSSGGCEEFYVWKISRLPSEMGGIGVVCEASCPPESEHSDLRIMAFDVAQYTESPAVFFISMVFSNSVVKVYAYMPTQPERWHKLASGLYFTSCLTQCAFLPMGERKMPQSILTAGTDGHAVLWAFSPPPTQAPETLTYRSPTTIHQSSTKTLVTHVLPTRSDKTLIISGGDDGTVSFLLARCTSINGVEWAGSPVTVVRTHASAVTACAVVSHNGQLLLITSGNDQWVRMWELVLCVGDGWEEDKDWIEIRRAGKVKTRVADVSSMAVVGGEDMEGDAARVLICGVGMEVIRVGGNTQVGLGKGERS